jgi:RNA recognition motif-containing protein
MFEEQYPNVRKQNKSVTNALTSFASKSIGLSLSTSGIVTISNIPWQVEASDLAELFQNFHDYEKAELVFDRSGRPTGAALIHFHKRAAGRKFVEQYDGVKLDGQVMKVLEGDHSRDYNGENADQLTTTTKDGNGPKPRGRGNAKFQSVQRKIVRIGE